MIWGRARTGGQGKPWTSAEREILRSGREQSPPLTFERLAKQLPGRTGHQCSCQWQTRRTWETKQERPGAGLVETLARVPQRLLADRAARDELRFNAPRSFTATHLNDPLPGRSALDAKLAADPSADPERIINPYASLTTMRHGTRPPAQPSLYWGKLSPDRVREASA